MNKRVGFLALTVAAAIGMFLPSMASAQNRYDYRGGYEARDYRVREWRPECPPVRIVRERPFVEGGFVEGGYGYVGGGYAPAYGSGYYHGFRRPEPRRFEGPRHEWYGR
jgi:hypothetical protein